jgi:cell division protease FtsH
MAAGERPFYPGHDMTEQTRDSRGTKAKWVAWKAKTRQALGDAWGGMEGADKGVLLFLVAVAMGGAFFAWTSHSQAELEKRYAAVKKVEIKGLVAAGEKLAFPQESSLALLKQDPGARVVEFHNAIEARGPVDSLFLLKSSKSGVVNAKIVSQPEFAMARTFMKDKDRLDLWQFVDYETLAESEKEAVQGLALKLAPPGNAETKKMLGGAMLLFNILINVVLLAFVLRMLKQGGKSLKFIRPAKIKGAMADLVGMEDIKSEVMRIKDFLENRPAYSEYGIERPTNILFSGPPGTGKTKLAGYLAKELKLPVLFHSAANLETGFVNGGGQTLERALAMAKKEKRCMIFLDEAQDLFMKRGQSGRKFDDDTQNTLLSMLDGVRTTKDVEIIWVVASNFNSNSMQMDEAMLRRFPLKIDFRLPNAMEREGIFNYYLDKARDKVDPNIDLKSLAHVTEGCSPADIESIVYEAGLAAINRKEVIDADTLMQAVERTLIGNTDSETTKGRERERAVIALHEVGHFLVDAARHCGDDLSKAADFKDKIGTIKISLKANARSNALGFVLKKPQNNMLQTKRDLEWEIMTLFGGMANEEIFFGEDGVTNGAYSDIQEITKMLGRAVSGLGIYKDAKLNFSALTSSRDGSNQVSEEDRAVMKKVSQDLFEKTKALLERRRDLSEHLAHELAAAMEMKAEDMLDLISAFCRKEQEILAKG